MKLFLNEINFLSVLNCYSFFLEGLDQKQNELLYHIKVKQNMLIYIQESINKITTQTLTDITENHTLIRRLYKNNEFIETMKCIKRHEKAMKENLKLNNIKYEGKISNGNYVIFFELISAVFNYQENTVNIKNIKPNQWTFIKNERKIYLSVERKNNTFIFSHKLVEMLPNSFLINKMPFYEAFHNLEQFHTHLNFAKDIHEILAKEPRIRVKMLVN